MNDDWVWIPDTAPSLANFLAVTPQPIPVLPVAAILAATLYLAGVVALARKGRRWPVWRAVTFIVGCAIIVVVMGAGIEGYGYLMFSVFMFQQLTLMMLVPPLLVLGSPGTLLLRATPHSPAGSFVLRAALGALRARWARVLLHPAFMIPLFLMSFYGIYLSGIANSLVGSWAGHNGLEALFLVSGILFTVPVLSADPLPRRQSHLGKMADVFTEIPLHAFFGVIVMMASQPLVQVFAERTSALGLDPLQDQLVAGGLAWSYGEAPGLIILLILMGRWFRDDTDKAEKADRAADLNGTPELDAYNDYLNALRRRDGTNAGS